MENCNDIQIKKWIFIFTNDLFCTIISVSGGEDVPNVELNGAVIPVETDTLISDCLKSAKMALPCGGNGVCGKCKVVVMGNVSPLTNAEKNLLTQTEIDKGIRLACYTHILGDCTIQSLVAEVAQIQTSTHNVVTSGCTRAFRFGAAIDIGTTTVAASLYDAAGRCLATATAVNPQIAHGMDVLSRVEAAVDGRGTELSAEIRTCIGEILHHLAESAHIDVSHIDSVVVTGNTVMLCLFTATAVESLLKAPFNSSRYFGEIVTASECGVLALAGNTPVYLPRCLDAFLGADLVCAVLSTGMCNGEESALLVDIGTNGEMALWHDNVLYVCSTAAGPAFEGIGVSCGTAAIKGAIECVEVVNDSLFAYTIGGGLATGICGSGLIDTLACLLSQEELDTEGTLSMESIRVTNSIYLTRSDVQSLILAKSAIRSGIDTLLFRAGITVKDVDHLYIAGGFGNTLNLHNAVRIGLLPNGFEYKASFVGNAALQGAAELLFKPYSDSILTWRKVELATDEFFADAFIRNMRFK